MDRPNVTQFCDELKLNRFHWGLLILGTMTLIFDGYDSQVLSYVMPHIIREWRLSPVTAGSVVSYGLIGLMIGTAVLGMLADRIGRKIPLILGLVIFSVFNGGLYWVHSFKTFCILRFCAGIGMGGTLVLNITLASEFAPARIRARVVGIMMVGFLLGPALAGLCSILFVPSHGWRIMLFFALLPLLSIPLLYYFLPESVRFLVQKGRFDRAIAVLRRMEKGAAIQPIEWTEESLALPAAARKVSVDQLFTSKLAVMTVLVWLTYFFTLFGGYTLTTWLPTLLNRAGLSLIRSYAYTLVSNGGSIVGSVILGMALDRFGRKRALITIYLACALVSWLFGLATGSPVALYVLAVGTGIFYGGGASAQHAVTGEIYPTFVRSTGVGWALTMGRFGAICGPVFGGILQSAGFSFSQIFGLIAVPPLICATLVCFYRVNVKGEGLETVQAELTGAAD
jgi:AAHS family benzoate transporter-like MFS transporter